MAEVISQWTRQIDLLVSPGRADRTRVLKYRETTPYLYGSHLRVWARLWFWEESDHEEE